MAEFDLAIIGGGINGAGIARDAAGRGLRVLLVEQNDLASGTSSASTKLIHGGLRYLEHGWFRLVREALAEREVLLRMAPHLVRPMRFVLPAEPACGRPGCCALGLFIYDHLGGRKLLPATRTLDLAERSARRAAQGRATAGFEYSDCRADDARLVVLNARRCGRARRRHPHAHALRARRARRRLAARCSNARGRRDVVTARVLVNATGPWVGACSPNVLRHPPLTRLRLDKGSHIVVRRLFEHDRGYIFQTADGRVVFALPYEGDFTLIGTTDRGFTGDPAAVAPARRRDRLSVRRGERLFPHAIIAGGRGVVVCRRALAATTTDRRSRRIRTATMCSTLDDARRGAAAHRLWRQDHDLPAAGGSGARPPGAIFGAAAGLDGEIAPAGRRFSGRRGRTIGRARRAVAGRS